ncbi:hypothetical protein [Photobacterium phosphoreum]|uniref:hypothetical protein n=1 Tax=Photobacterium phosphoreum TaxID=659 RepID=UPI001E36F7CB|nr:hypothetical protein [Photobacterium phosphoreum]MCD9519476.1 hypothetical protein [Photobacterium phosphoreum]
MSEQLIIPPSYMSAKGVANLFGMTEGAVKKMCQRGELPTKPRCNGQRTWFINMYALHVHAVEQVENADKEWLGWKDRFEGFK